MSFGLSVMGDAGNIQIDENWSNHHYSGSGITHTTTLINSSGFGVPASYVDVTLTNCRNTLLAIRCELDATYVLIARSGTTWTFRFIVSDPAASSTVGTSITYYRFDTNPSPSAGGFGLRVWDGSGNLTFDSGYKHMHVRDFLMGIKFASAMESRVWAYEAGKTFAAIPARSGGLYLGVDDPGGGVVNTWWYSHLMRSTSAHQFRAIALLTQIHSPVSPRDHYECDADWLIVDVTNF